MAEKGQWIDGFQEYYEIVPCSTPVITSEALNDTGRQQTNTFMDVGGEWVSLIDLLEQYATPIAEIGSDDEGAVHVNQAGFSNDVNARYDEHAPGSAPHAYDNFLWIKGRMDHGVTLPAGVGAVDLAGVFVAKASPYAEMGFQVTRLDASGQIAARPLATSPPSTQPIDGSLQRWVLPFQDTPADELSAVANGRYFLRVNVTPVEVNYEVAFLGLRVAWWVEEPEPARLLAPLRQFPRSDALGAGSARRIIPTPASEQRGLRRMGGYF